MDDRRYRPLTEPRGVSDVIGYVLTFSVVALAVLAATGVGFTQLQEVRSNEELTNAERAFQLIEQNFDQIQQSQAETSRSEISLDAGSLRFRSPPGTSTLTVTVNNTGKTHTLPMNSLEYGLDDTVIAFEGGAVFYQDQNTNTILEDGPEMFCRQRGSRPARAIVSVVRLQGSSSSAFSGGTIGITGEHNSSELLFPVNQTGADSVGESTGVTVEIDSDYGDAWREHFDDEDNGWTQTGANTYRCTDSSDGIQVFVRQTVLDVRFAR
jgi:type II secretory pathway pseudopilin PulG